MLSIADAAIRSGRYSALDLLVTGMATISVTRRMCLASPSARRRRPQTAESRQADPGDRPSAVGHVLVGEWRALEAP